MGEKVQRLVQEEIFSISVVINCTDPQEKLIKTIQRLMHSLYENSLPNYSYFIVVDNETPKKNLFKSSFYTAIKNLLHQRTPKLLKSFRTLHFREAYMQRTDGLFWQTFLLQCVGLRRAALNNLNLLMKNSQLCPVQCIATVLSDCCRLLIM